LTITYSSESRASAQENAGAAPARAGRNGIGINGRRPIPFFRLQDS